MKAKFNVYDNIYICQERKDNKITHSVMDGGKETVLNIFDINDDREHGVCYFNDYIFAWSNDKKADNLKVDAIYDINRKRNISLNPDNNEKYKYALMNTKSFKLTDVLTLINCWDYKYGETASFRALVNYLTGGDKEISRECIIDYIYNHYPELKPFGSYKEPVSTTQYQHIVRELGTNSLCFHMMPQVMFEDTLVDSMDRYINELRKLRKKDPEEAKKIAIEGLIRMGIINESGEFIPPYNDENINPDDFTRGPKLSRSKND